nr:ferrochelatase protoheme ferro-lyase [uncultured bacterium]
MPEVREYLRQFLSDPRIIDLPGWQRSLIVNLFVLPFRPKKTGEAYEAIWTKRGSPLIAFSEDFRDALQTLMPDAIVKIGMAYGSPKIPDVLDELAAAGVERIIAVPMFPQYASATTGSVIECVYKHCAKKWNVPALSVLPPYFDDPGYLDAWKDVAAQALAEFRPDHVLLSYHGLPERQIKKCDPSGNHCLASAACCDVEVPANRMCYRRHCMVTSRALAERLGLGPEGHSVTFQSRLGRDPWLRPATDETIVALAKRGVKRLAVLSPAFVADCLETLEEIGIQARASFLEHGGEDFLLVPSLNANPAWVSALHSLISRM